MRALALLGSWVVALGSVAGLARAQPERPTMLPEVDLRYTIAARFDPRSRGIEAREVIRFRNWSEAELTRVHVHLYQNAFSHSQTTWMRDSGALRGFDLEEALEHWPDPWGYVDIAAVARCDDVSRAIRWARQPPARASDGPPAGRTLALRFIQPDDDNALDRSLAEVQLPSPLVPGAELCLAIAFRTRLPIPIARTGAIEGYVHAAQWFPKLGVLEPAGKRGIPQPRWAARQFHGPTEFYADFADFEVTLQVPSKYTLIATGEARPLSEPTPGQSAMRFTQRAVHDFSWLAGRRLHVETHVHAPRGGGPQIAISYALPRGQAHMVPRIRNAAETTFDVLGERIGTYPYSTMKVVHPPYHAGATAGMEYPTLVTGTVGVAMWSWPILSRVRLLEATIAHEIGHNYFYGLLASDEQRDAFLDEGINSYWESVVMKRLAGSDPRWSSLIGHPIDDQRRARRRLGRRKAAFDEAVAKGPSDLFYPGTHGDQIYTRPELILATAERRFGDEAVDALFRSYFERFRFRHPDSEDFFALIDEIAQPEMAGFLREAFHARTLYDYRVVSATSERFTSPLGRVPGDGGVVTVTESSRSRLGEAGLGFPAGTERADAVAAEITDPGYSDARGSRDGRVQRVWLEKQGGTGAAADGDRYVSRARLRGPGARHLPVDVRFEFDDGTVLVDRWDGRASWRDYRFARRARMRSVIIDPDDELAIDVDPENNGRLVEPDSSLAVHWSSWLSAAVQWLIATVPLWL